MISGGTSTLALLLSTVVFVRQLEGRLTRLAAAASFGLGFTVVGSYGWGVSRLLFAARADEDLVTALFGGCWALFAAPLVLAIAVLLLRWWVRLAYAAGEKR